MIMLILVSESVQCDAHSKMIWWWSAIKYFWLLHSNWMHLLCVKRKKRKEKKEIWQEKLLLINDYYMLCDSIVYHHRLTVLHHFLPLSQTHWVSVCQLWQKHPLSLSHTATHSTDSLSQITILMSGTEKTHTLLQTQQNQRYQLIFVSCRDGYEGSELYNMLMHQLRIIVIVLHTGHQQ